MDIQNWIATTQPSRPPPSVTPLTLQGSPAYNSTLPSPDIAQGPNMPIPTHESVAALEQSYKVFGFVCLV